MRMEFCCICRSFVFILVAMASLSEQSSQSNEICGKTNGCFKWPKGCKLLDCRILVQFVVTNSSEMMIDISGKVDGWIAFGLNNKPRVMGGVQGEVCFKSVYGVYLRSFENKGTDFKLKFLDRNISTDVAVYKNGRMSCVYRRPIKTHSLRDVSKPHYIISSWGKIRKNGPFVDVNVHDVGDYFWSKSKVVLTQAEDVDVTTFGWILIAVHASLMIIAWVGFGFSGMFYARQMKEELAGKKICGTLLWFQAHRLSFFFCTLLVWVAFIVILVEAGGWNAEMEGHPGLGLVTIILLCLQVIAGIARPSPESSWRSTFKYVHRYIGIITYILAGATIMLGLALCKIDYIVGIVYFVMVIFIDCGYDLKRYKPVYDIEKTYFRDFVGHYFNFRVFQNSTENSTESSSENSSENSSDTDSIDESIDIEVTNQGAKRFSCTGLGGMLVTALGICMAFILLSLVVHKCSVYHARGTAT